MIQGLVATEHIYNGNAQCVSRMQQGIVVFSYHSFRLVAHKSESKCKNKNEISTNTHAKYMQ